MHDVGGLCTSDKGRDGKDKRDVKAWGPNVSFDVGTSLYIHVILVLLNDALSTPLIVPGSIVLS